MKNKKLLLQFFKKSSEFILHISKKKRYKIQIVEIFRNILKIKVSFIFLSKNTFLRDVSAGWFLLWHPSRFKHFKSTDVNTRCSIKPSISKIYIAQGKTSLRQNGFLITPFFKKIREPWKVFMFAHSCYGLQTAVYRIYLMDGCILKRSEALKIHFRCREMVTIK